MTNGLSERFRLAIDFLKKNGYAKNGVAVGKRLGYPKSTIYMCMNGTREPSWDLLIEFCDAYPISFDWLRTGAGGMVKEARELALLKRIEELEAEIARLKR